VCDHQNRFRYDDQEFCVGTVMKPRGDHIEGLTEHQKTVELAIRSKFGRCKIRETSLYVWRDKATAIRLWPHCGKKYLYELEVEASDVRFEGDLDFYSAAVDAVKGDQPFDCHVESYCGGELQSCRIEMLVSQARVSAVLCTRR
jgi:hypothetical protein